MPCGWEGNRRSGVALAMRHSQSSVVYTPTGDDHRSWYGTLYLFSVSRSRVTVVALTTNAGLLASDVEMQ